MAWKDESRYMVFGFDNVEAATGLVRIVLVKCKGCMYDRCGLKIKYEVGKG